MWREKETDYHFHLVENEGGKTLGYSPDSGVKIIEKDGFAFKDMARTGELLPFEDWRLSPEERAEDLGKRLSVEQVAGLMCYSVHQFKVEKELSDEQKEFLNQNVRSVLNSSSRDGIPSEVQVTWSNHMQEYAEKMPFAIPCYIASDPRNGQGVSDQPGNLSIAASFDPELAWASAKTQSEELRALGVACFLAPQVDVASDPRWFRSSGTFGEDPALSRDLTRAFCDGLQSTYGSAGNDLGWGKDSVTAMVKHWTGEAGSEGGREAHVEGGKYAVYPNHNFEALMIPFVDGAFKLQGKTGSAAAVMSSYSISYSEDGSLGELVGSSYSQYKIKQLLRTRYGFDGAVCTDWMVLNNGKRKNGWGQYIERDDVTPGERAFMAIMAGVDQMGGCSEPQYLIDAYRIGCEKAGKEVMDKAFAESAKRLLLGYFKTGLFENPYLDEENSMTIINSEEKQAEALAGQVRGIVMLKNEKQAVKKHDRRLKVYIPALYEAPHTISDHVIGVVQTEPKASYPLSLETAQKYFDVVSDRIDGAEITRASREEIKDCDLILITAKEPENSFKQDGRNPQGEWIPITRQYRPYTADGPYVRKVSIAGDILPDGTKQNRSYFGHTAMGTNPEQLDQILAWGDLGKELGIPSIVCMYTGKPMCFHEFEPSVDSILVTFSSPFNQSGGTASSDAIARIVAGLDEPSGLLPMQMPKDMEDVERQSEDTPRDMECYTDSVGHKYDFAYGMNYHGVIDDERVRKYSVPALHEPENKGK